MLDMFGLYGALSSPAHGDVTFCLLERIDSFRQGEKVVLLTVFACLKESILSRFARIPVLKTTCWKEILF